MEPVDDGSGTRRAPLGDPGQTQAPAAALAGQQMPPRCLLGIRIGHASDFRGLTGCTVILAEKGAVCGVDVRGSAAGTRDLGPCQPGHVVERVHAIFLTGGSAFGLDAARGVMEYLESRGAGFPTGVARVPIVPAAVIFDLGIGSCRARPEPAMARWACEQAARQVAEGSVGAGTGATVGKWLGLERAMKGGVGFSTVLMASGVAVQALAVVNAVGDVIDPASGQVVAGARREAQSTEWARTADQMLEGRGRKSLAGRNTTLVVVMTNASLDKVQAAKVAQMAQDGLARAIDPAHTMFDGDLVFTLSLGARRADVSTVGTAAARATAAAIVRAVKLAKGLGGIPGWQDFQSGRWRPKG